MKSGLTFKGVHSKKDIGVTMRSVSRMVLPAATRSTVNVTGRPGSVDFGIDTYIEGEITVNFSWIAVTPAESAKKGELLKGWLHNNGKYNELIFDDSPDRKYFAKVSSIVPMEIDACTGRVTVAFTVNPPFAFRLDNSPVSPEDVEQRLLWDSAKLYGNQYIQSLTSSGVMRFTLSGGIKVNPVIKIIGRPPATFTLSYNSQKWTYNATPVYDGIIIDCKNETVTRMSDGLNLFGNVSPTENTFFEFTPGQIEMSITGNIGEFPNNLSIAVDLTPGY